MRTNPLLRISPYIRLAGMQGIDDWPNVDRRIYDHQFFFCIQGEGTIHIEDVAYPIKEGTLFIIKPNVKHRYERNRKNPSECFWFHLDFEYHDDYYWLSEFYENLRSYLRLFNDELIFPEHIRDELVLPDNFKLPDVMNLKNKNYVLEQFRIIYESHLSDSPYWRLQANGALFNILHAIYTDSGGEDRKEISKKNYLVNRMISFIENNYVRNISARDVCSQGLYNPDYAGKIFKEVTGATVSEYLQDYRLNRARELFFNMELSISDIAYMCGFNSASYFSAVVKQKEGISPSELRAKLLNK